MEFTSSPKPQLSSRANAFSIAALMSSGKPSSKDKEQEENTIKPLGKDLLRPNWSGPDRTRADFQSQVVLFVATQQRKERQENTKNLKKQQILSNNLNNCRE